MAQAVRGINFEKSRLMYPFLDSKTDEQIFEEFRTIHPCCGQGTMGAAVNTHAMYTAGFLFVYIIITVALLYTLAYGKNVTPVTTAMVAILISSWCNVMIMQAQRVVMFFNCYWNPTFQREYMEYTGYRQRNNDTFYNAQNMKN